MIEIVAITALVGLNVFQLVYWSRQVQKLVDKVMSRDYHTYQISKQPLHTPPKPISPADAMEDLSPLNDFGVT